MKEPKFFFNREESYVEFYTTEGTVKVGLRDLKIFIENSGIKNYLSNSVNNVFAGSVDLTLPLTHYAEYNVLTNLDIVPLAGPVIGSYAELRLIGDGSHSPVFDASMTATPGSDTYDDTLNAVNKVGVYYDGYDIYYTVTVIP